MDEWLERDKGDEVKGIKLGNIDKKTLLKWLSIMNNVYLNFSTWALRYSLNYTVF